MLVFHTLLPPLIQFHAVLREWPGESFARQLKQAIEALPAEALPLRAAATRSGLVEDHGHEVRILGVRTEADRLHVNLGVFFREILTACSCGDEPQLLDAYCELSLDIDRADGCGRFTLIPDPME